MNVLGSSLKPSSLEAEIAFDYEASAEANAIVNAILPDNIKLPKDLTIKTARQGKKVMINVECGECLLTFIATVDDLLEAISTAERSVSAVKENTNDL